MQSKLELLELELKKVQLRADTDRLEAAQKKLEEERKNPALKPWWQKLVDLLALPTAVVALASGIITASGTVQTQKKTAAETAQITQSINKPAETQKLATDLAEKQKEGPGAYGQAATQNAGKIQEALQRLNQIDTHANATSPATIFTKFILIWILFHVVSLVFDIISQVWSMMMNSLNLTANYWTNKRRDDNASFERRFRLQRLVSATSILLSQAPNIVRWSIQLSIVVTLLAPFFDEIALQSGSPVRFAEIMREAKHLQFGAMLATMSHALFGS